MLTPPARRWMLAAAIVSLGVAAQPKAGVAAALPARAAAVSHRLSAAKHNPSRLLSALPLTFERNEGQVNPAVRFLARGAGFTLFLTDQGAVLVLSKQAQSAHPTAIPWQDDEHTGSPARFRPHQSRASEAVIRLTPRGMIRRAISGLARQPGVVNYLIGRDARRWHTGIPTFGEVIYRNVYHGIDLAFYGRPGGDFEYDWLVHPGANPARIRLRVSGARAMTIDGAGGLVLHTALGSLHQSLPSIYQPVAAGRFMVAGRFAITGKHTVGFRLGRYDRHRLLVIDPAVNVKLFYSTYLGGSDENDPMAIAVDSAGSAYVSGETFSVDFPTCPGADARCAGPGTALQTANGDTLTAFVSKLNPAGTRLIYSTYLGGSGGEGIGGFGGIAVDASGSAYVTGDTASTDFPICPGLDPRCAVGVGTPLQAMNLQDTGACGPGLTGFVSKLNASGTKLIYSTYLGGSCAGYVDNGLPQSLDEPTGIAVDGAGAAYVSGSTQSFDYPTCPGADSRCASHAGTALQPARLDGAPNDVFDVTFTGFVSKLDPSGSQLVYSTYLGGQTPGPFNPEAQDVLNGIAIDAAGGAYVTGASDAVDFPTCPGADPRCGGPGSALQTVNLAAPDHTAIVARLDPTGLKLVYSTYLGGSDQEIGNGIAVDPGGNAYMTGATESPDFPTCPGADPRCATPGTALQTVFLASDGTVFVSELNPTGLKLVYSTFLGGSDDDIGEGIAVDPSGNAFVTGGTFSTDFPTCPGLDPRCAANGTALQTSEAATPNGTAFVAEVMAGGLTIAFSTYLGGTGGELGFGIALDAAGDAYVVGGTGSTDFPTCPGADPRCTTAGTALEPVNLATPDATVFVAKLGAVDDTTLTAGLAWAAAEGAAHTQVIAHWSDAFLPGQGDATFTVLWGDGATSTCSNVAATPTCFSASSPLRLVNCNNAATSCDLQATHTFVEESEPGTLYTISVSVSDADQSPAPVSTTTSASITDVALSAGASSVTLSNGANPAGTCSQSLTCSGIISTFTDANVLCDAESEPVGTNGAPHYLISIAWGDGSANTSPTQVSQPSNCSFAVAGSHVYATPGPKSITVTVTDEGCADNIPANSGGCRVVLTAGVTVVPVNDATTTGGRQLSGGEATSVTGTVGAFSDADNLSAPDWTITLAWGDGSSADTCTVSGPKTCAFSTSATPPAGSPGSVQLYGCDSATVPTHCLVQGTHTYTREGQFQITLTLTDGDASSQPAPAVSSAAISPGPDDATLSAGAPWNNIEGTSKTQVLGYWSDVDGGAPEPADARFAVVWPDGHVDYCTTYASSLQSCFAPGSALQLVNCNAPQTACDVQGTHTTVEESEPGAGPIALFASDPDQASPALVVGIPVSTADAALTAGPPGTLASPAGGTCAPFAPCGGVAGTFTDTNSSCAAEGEALDPTTGAPHYVITINWGDGTASSAPTGVSPTAACSYRITGSHAYTAPGTYTITVTVTDEGCADGGAGCSITIGGPGSSITNKVTVSIPASSNISPHTTISATPGSAGQTFFTFTASYRAALGTTPAGFNGVLGYKENTTPFFINAFGVSGSAIPPGINAPPNTLCNSSNQPSPGCTLTIDAIQCASTGASVYGHYVPPNGVPYYFWIQVNPVSVTGPGTFQMTTNSPVGLYSSPVLPAITVIVC